MQIFLSLARKQPFALNLPNSTDHWTQFYSCSMINHWPLASETQVQLALQFARPVKEEPTPATKVFCLVFQDILLQFCNHYIHWHPFLYKLQIINQFASQYLFHGFAPAPWIKQTTVVAPLQLP
jgi:hypothetical protein